MDNKQRAAEYNKQVWTDKNADAVFEFCSEDVIIHSPIRTLTGPAAMKSILEEWYTGFPDITVQWDALVAEDNKVVCIWHCEGTHQNEFLGMPASNNRIQYKGVSVYEFEEEKVKEYWAIVDIENIKQQCEID